MQTLVKKNFGTVDPCLLSAQQNHRFSDVQGTPSAKKSRQLERFFNFHQKCCQ